MDLTRNLYAIYKYIQYICLHRKGPWNDNWPTTKDKEFWDGCAQAVKNACKSQRSGMVFLN